MTSLWRVEAEPTVTATVGQAGDDSCGGSFGQVKVVGFADRLILSSDAVRSFAKRTMLLRHVNLLPRPAKRMPPCRRRGSYCAADNRGLREASPEARHRSPTAKCCRCFAADQRAAYPPCDWFGGTKTGQKPPTDFRGPSRRLRITIADAHQRPLPSTGNHR